MNKRVLTRSEAKLGIFQGQGSYPDGGNGLVFKTHSLYDTLYFAINKTEFQLFGQSQGQSSMFDTNMVGANSLPGGQSMTAIGISFAFHPGTVTDANTAELVQAFYDFMRNSVWTFNRVNEDWSAKFHGSKVLPSITTYTETAGNRVGDFSKTGMHFKFATPVVIGQNCGFEMKANIRTALIAGNALVTAGAAVQVSLDGVLTKKQAN